MSAKRTERILVVDDELTVLRLCTGVLEAEGYQVRGVGGGREALALLEEEQFDLLLVDLLMPGVNGITVLRKARELDPHVMAIVITGYGTLENVVEALRAGARDLVLKPFSYDDLLPAVVRALKARRREQENLLLRTRLPILEVAQALMTAGNIESLAQRLLEVVAQQIGADRAALLLLDEDELYVASAVGFPAEITEQTRVPADQGPAQRVLLREEPLVVDESEAEPLLQAFSAGPGGPTVWVPLRTRTGAIGALALSRLDSTRPFAPSELNLLSIMGGQMAIALENTHLYEAVRESEARYRTLFQSANDAIFLMRGERFIDCNRATEVMFGYSRDDVLGSTPYRFSPPRQPDGMDSREKALEKIGAALAGTPQSFEWAHCRQDGTPFDAEISLNRLDLDGEPLILAIVRDITARKKAEETLRERARFDKLVGELSTRFVNLGVDRIDDEIENAFGDIGAYFDLDRIVLWELSKDGKQYHIGHSWSTEGVEPVRATLSVDAVPYIRDTLLIRGQPFAFSSVEEIPAEAVAERQYYDQQGIKSSLVLPLTIAGDVIGGISVSVMRVHRDWSAETMQRLSLLCEIFSNVLVRKRINQDLVTSQARLSGFMNSASDSFYLLDSNMIFVEINERALAVIGRPREQIIGKHITEIVPDIKESGRYEQHLEVMRTGQPFEIEDFVPHPVFGDRHFVLKSFPVGDGLGVIASDITKRKKAEEALRESERRYRLLIENVPVVVWVTRQDGQTVFISANVEEVYGYSPGEIMGEGEDLWFGRIHPEDRPRVHDAFEALFAERKQFDVQYRIQCKDGRWIWLHDRANIVEERAGQPHAYGVFSDITERKQAEEALHRYAERLEILHEIDQGILAAQSPQAIAQAALSRVHQLIPCQRITVALLDAAADEVVILTVDVAETQVGEGARLPMALVTDLVEVLQQGQVARGEGLSLRGEIGRIAYAEGVHSLISVPLIAQEELVGALNFGMAESTTFTDEHQDVARQVADQLAIAIQQARLLEQVQRHAEELEERVADRTRELSTMYEVLAIASESRDLETTLARSLAQILAAVQSDVGTIHLLNEEDPASQTWQLAVQQGIAPDLVVQIASQPVGKRPGEWVLQHGEPFVVPDITFVPEMTVTASVTPHRYAGVPIRASGRVLGVLSVLREVAQPEFGEDEIALLTSLADQVGVVVESQRLRKLAEQAAVLEERQRLARELHDSVTQALYSLTLLAETGRRSAQAGDLEHVAGYLERLGTISQQALKEMRLLIYELRPSALEQEGLVGALQQRLDAVEGRAGVETRLLVEHESPLPAPVEETLYRIALEALNNALKHAAATAVTVRIRGSERDGGWVELDVTDDGQGFDPRAVGDAGGMGLVTMRERAERLDGTLTIRSAPGEGTSVQVRVRAGALVNPGDIQEVS